MKQISRNILFGLAIFSLALSLNARAQNLSADEILENIAASAESLQDSSFTLDGQIIDFEGNALELEVEVQIIPGLELARVYFLQPDALADNFIVLDQQDVYNYLFLTNQVQIFNASDPDALGGLFPEADSGENLDISIDLSRMFEGWEVSVEGYENSPVGDVYLLRLVNQDQAADIGYINASIVDNDWRPYRLELIDAGGDIVAELVFNDFLRDQGLEPADLRFIPADAEIIDER